VQQGVVAALAHLALRTEAPSIALFTQAGKAETVLFGEVQLLISRECFETTAG